MKILIIVDKFCSRKNIEDKATLDTSKPIAPQIYELLTGEKYDEDLFKEANKIYEDA